MPLQRSAFGVDLPMRDIRRSFVAVSLARWFSSQEIEDPASQLTPEPENV
jgi:hypothetical protein